MTTYGRRFFAAVLVLSIWNPALAQAQGTPFSEIPLDSIPDGVSLQGAGGISLEGDVVVAGSVESGPGGFVFPDGTVQTTAATAVEGASGNAGLYANRIMEMTPSQPYSEICFKEGTHHGDIHVTSESTAGGFCLPGDVGFIVERNQRTAAEWEMARVQCLLAGMRLPEPFEWMFGCNVASTYGLNNMTGDFEWASNTATPATVSATGLAVAALGQSNCNHGSWSWVISTGGGTIASNTFRCVR